MQTQNQFDDAFIADLERNDAIRRRRSADARLFKFAIGLTVVNTLVITWFVQIEFQDPMKIAAIPLVIGLVFVPVLSVVTGILLGFFPSRKFGYLRRFIRISIVAALVLGAMSIALFALAGIGLLIRK